MVVTHPVVGCFSTYLELRIVNSQLPTILRKEVGEINHSRSTKTVLKLILPNCVNL